MSEPPRLAVIIPCFNYASYVGDAIRSVTSQRRDDVELLVIDDGSTDDSWNVIQSFPDVSSERLENGGALRTCIYGLDRTTSPFVLFLDADDLLAPGSLAEILSRLDPDVAKLQFSLRRIDAAGNVIGSAVPTVSDFRDRDGLAAQVIRTGVYLSPPTSGNVFRRDLAELLREVDYDRLAVDGITLFAAPFLGDVVSISAELGYYRIHGRNASSLGGVPTEAVLAESLRRFDATMLHLERVLTRLGHRNRLTRPCDLYVHRELSFCRAVAAGIHPGPSELVGVLTGLIRYPMPAKNKVFMAIFFLLAALAPSERAKALLAYRYKVDGRTGTGFLKLVLFGNAKPIRAANGMFQ